MQDGVYPTCWLQDEAHTHTTHTSCKLQNMAVVGRSAAATKEVSYIPLLCTAAW